MGSASNTSSSSSSSSSNSSTTDQNPPQPPPAEPSSTTTSAAPPSSSQPQIPAVITVSDIDAEFLPLFYDIIKSVERESSDAAQAKRSEFTETAHKVLEFQKKLDLIREQIKKLPGIDLSKEDQLKKLEALRKQLILKKRLLQKYKDMCALEGVKQYLTPSTNVNVTSTSSSSSFSSANNVPSSSAPSNSNNHNNNA